MCKIGDVWQFTALWFMSNLDNILILMLIHPCLQMVSFWQALEYHASRVAVSQQIFFRNTNARFSWNILYFWILTRHGGRKKTLKRFGTKRIVWKRTSFLFCFNYLYLWNFYPCHQKNKLRFKTGEYFVFFIFTRFCSKFGLFWGRIL